MITTGEKDPERCSGLRSVFRSSGMRGDDAALSLFEGERNPPPNLIAWRFIFPTKSDDNLFADPEPFAGTVGSTSCLLNTFPLSRKGEFNPLNCETPIRSLHFSFGNSLGVEALNGD